MSVTGRYEEFAEWNAYREGSHSSGPREGGAAEEWTSVCTAPSP